MQFSNRMPKAKRIKFTSKRLDKRTDRKLLKNLQCKNSEQAIKGLEKLSHPELREIQRYGTLCVNKREIVEAIYNDKAIIIKSQDNIITALVRYANRYYIVVMDVILKVIKTFLPDDISNFLDYVQMYIDKENSKQMPMAAWYYINFLT